MVDLGEIADRLEALNRHLDALHPVQRIDDVSSLQKQTKLHRELAAVGYDYGIQRHVQSKIYDDPASAEKELKSFGFRKNSKTNAHWHESGSKAHGAAANYGHTVTVTHPRMGRRVDAARRRA